jgi:restriction system protein
MAEITRERVGQLQRGIFRVLLDHPDGLPAKEVLANLQEEVPPTPFEASDYPNRPGVRRFEKIARFVTIAPVKAGWLVKDRGHWHLTDLGRAALESHTDPAKFAREASRLYKLWEEQRPESEVEDEQEVVVSAAATLEEAEEAAWSEIESYLSDLNPYDFQVPR